MKILGRAVSVLGGLGLVGASLLTYACSTSTGTDPSSGALPTTPTGDSGSTPRPDGSVTPPTRDGGDGGVNGEDSGRKCYPPVLTATKPDEGPFCPFSKVDGGKNIYCAAAQQCCETPRGAGPSTCISATAACPVPGSIAWQCEDSSNCGTGKVCCGAVTLTPDPECGYLRGDKGFTGTSCKAACAAGELQICQQATGCPTGKTCKEILVEGNEVGACK